MRNKYFKIGTVFTISLLLLFSSIIMFNPLASATGEDWWDGDWDYRQKFAVSTSSGTLTGYQIEFLVYQSTGTSSGTTIFCDGDCESDFDDIRFTTDGETPTLLDHWIQSYTTAGEIRAVIWVEFDTIDSDGEDFYVYYGNSAASSVSSGDDTFLFFDDFEDGSLDSNKWVEYNMDTGASFSEQNGLLCLNDTSVEDDGITLTSGDGLYARTNSSTYFNPPENGFQIGLLGLDVEYTGDTPQCHWGISFCDTMSTSDGHDDDLAMCYTDAWIGSTRRHYGCYDDTKEYVSAVADYTGDYYVYKDTNDEVDTYYDGNQLLDGDEQTNTLGYMFIHYGGHKNANYDSLELDLIYMAKWQSAGPSVGSWNEPEVPAPSYDYPKSITNAIGAAKSGNKFDLVGSDGVYYERYYDEVEYIVYPTSMSGAWGPYKSGTLPDDANAEDDSYYERWTYAHSQDQYPGDVQNCVGDYKSGMLSYLVDFGGSYYERYYDVSVYNASHYEYHSYTEFVFEYPSETAASGNGYVDIDDVNAGDVDGAGLVEYYIYLDNTSVVLDSGTSNHGDLSTIFLDQDSPNHRYPDGTVIIVDLTFYSTNGSLSAYYKIDTCLFELHECHYSLTFNFADYQASSYLYAHFDNFVGRVDDYEYYSNITMSLGGYQREFHPSDGVELTFFEKHANIGSSVALYANYWIWSSVYLPFFQLDYMYINCTQYRSYAEYNIDSSYSGISNASLYIEFDDVLVGHTANATYDIDVDSVDMWSGSVADALILGESLITIGDEKWVISIEFVYYYKDDSLTLYFQFDQIYILSHY